MAHSFRDLTVWQRAMQLTVSIYRLTREFPREEIYGLTSQMRRSAVSVPSNIAEGVARQADKELIYFLHVALGSIAELDTLYILAKEFRYTDGCTAIEKAIEDVRKMTVGLLKRLKKD